MKFADLCVKVLVTGWLVVLCHGRLSADTFVIPHFAVGVIRDDFLSRRSFVTIVMVVNKSTMETSVSIEAFGADGERINLSVSGLAKIPPQGVSRFFVVKGGPVVSGWLSVRSTVGPVVVRGSIAVRDLSTFAPPPSTGFPTTTVTDTDADPSLGFELATVPVVFQPEANGRPVSTGLAFAFPASNQLSALVTLTLHSADGTKIADRTLTMPPNGHTAFFVDELFPEIRTFKIGVLTVEGSPFARLYGVAVDFQGEPLVMRTVEFEKLR